MKLLFPVVMIALLSVANCQAAPIAQPVADGIWYRYENTTTVWSIQLDDPQATEALHVTVTTPRQGPARMSIVRHCSNNAYSVTSFQLGDTAIKTVNCRGHSVNSNDSDLVTLLSSMPEPPLQIRLEVTDLLLQMGAITDRE